jgi:hypothetical protein
MLQNLIISQFIPVTTSKFPSSCSTTCLSCKLSVMMHDNLNMCCFWWMIHIFSSVSRSDQVMAMDNGRFYLPASNAEHTTKNSFRCMISSKQTAGQTMLWTCLHGTNDPRSLPATTWWWKMWVRIFCNNPMPQWKSYRMLLVKYHN